MSDILFRIVVEDSGLNARLKDNRDTVKQINNELKAVGEGTARYKVLAEQLVRTRVEATQLRDRQRELNRDFKATQVPTDSLAGLRLEYAKLTTQIGLLSKAQRESGFGQTLIKNAAGVKKEIDGIEQSVGRFTGNVGNYKQGFASLTQIISGGIIGGGIAVSIGAITDAFSKGISAVEDYGAALSRLSAITGVTGDGLLDLENRAKELTTIEVEGQKIINTSQGIFEAFTLVGSARPELLKDSAALQEVAKSAIVLSKASGDDLKTSVEAITSGLAQFGLEASDSVEIINLLAAGSKEGKVEIPGLADQITRLGPTAKNANVSLAETVAIFETLADRGLQGERASVQLRNILIRLASAEVLPRKAQEAFKEFGVNAEILADKTLPIEERFRELGKVAGDTAALYEIFGSENIDAAAILSESVPKYNQVLAAIQNTNEAFKQAGINADNTKTKIQNLKNEGINLLTQAFLSVEPAIGSVVDFLSNFISLLSDAPEIIADNADELIALSFVVLSLNRNVTALTTSTGRAAVAQTLSNLATSAGTIVTAALGAVMSALPIIAVVAGLYAIAKVIEFYEESASAAGKATKLVAEAQGEIAKESAKEFEAVRKNISILSEEKSSKEARKKAITDLTAAYPEYLKGMDLEKANLTDLTILQNRLTESIIRSVAERKKSQATEKITEKIIAERLNETRLRTEGFSNGEAFVAGLSGTTVNKAIDKSIEKQKELEEQLKAVEAQFDKTFGIGKNELLIVIPDRVDTIDLTGARAGNTSGGDIGSGGGKIEKTKTEADAAAGSIEFLRDKIQKLQKQIEQTPGDSKILDSLILKLKQAEFALAELEAKLDGIKNPVKAISEDQNILNELAGGASPLTKLLDLSPDQKESAIEFDGDEVAEKEETQRRLEELDNIYDKKKMERDEKAAEDEIARRKRLKDAIISAAEEVASALFQIQANRIQKEEEEQISAVDKEFEARLEAAQGNSVLTEQLEKEKAAKIEQIERESAEERKALAKKEALIQGALAVVKALPNFILAALAAVTTAAQIAIIDSQSFAVGGFTGPGGQRDETGQRVAGSYMKGKTQIVYHANEYISPADQVQRFPELFNFLDLDRRKKTRSFAGGGFTDFIPQVGLSSQNAQPTVILTGFTKEAENRIAETIAREVANSVKAPIKEGAAEGLSDATRLRERQNAANVARQI